MTLGHDIGFSVPYWDMPNFTIYLWIWIEIFDAIGLCTWRQWIFLPKPAFWLILLYDEVSIFPFCNKKVFGSSIELITLKRLESYPMRWGKGVMIYVLITSIKKERKKIKSNSWTSQEIRLTQSPATYSQLWCKRLNIWFSYKVYRTN